MALNVFGSAPAGLQAFEDKGFGGDDFRLVEHIGKAGIFKVQGPQDVNTRNGLKTAIKADVTIFDGEGGSQEFSDVLIFNMAPVDQLKPYAGQEIVALIGEYESKSGGKAPKLEAPTQAVIAAAEKVRKA